MLSVVGGPFGANPNCRAHCSSKDGTLVCLSVCPPGRLWSFCQRVAIHRLRALGVTHTGWAQVETGIQVACLCSLGFLNGSSPSTSGSCLFNRLQPSAEISRGLGRGAEGFCVSTYENTPEGILGRMEGLVVSDRARLGWHLFPFLGRPSFWILG